MTLKEELKTVIVEGLNLVDIEPDDIKDDDSLFGEKFGLDSIDAVEVIYQVKEHFGVAIRDMKEGRPALQSINTLAAFIEKRLAATSSFHFQQHKAV
jgi:acyl carrier protein